MDARQRKLATDAWRQHGVFTLAHALDAGYSRHAIRRRVASGQWSELDTRVYMIASGLRPTDRQRLMARTLATRGIACGASAAALFGLLPFPKEPQIVVTLRHKPAGHREVRTSDGLPPIDVAPVDGIPSTRPVRTVIDVAACLPLERYEDLLDTAIVRRVVRMDRLEQRARELRGPHRGHCAVVLELLAARHPELGRARSEMEARVLRMLHELGFPPPTVDFRVRCDDQVRIIDFAWPDRMVALEFDGFVPHSSRRVFDDDRVRQNQLVGEGWQVYRITKTALVRDPGAALARVRRALDG